MKKNRLYTVNEWNQPAFMPANRFDWGGLAAADKKANPWNYADDVDTTQQYMDSTNAFGLSKADNPFSKGNIAGGIGAMANTGIGRGIIGAVGSVASKAAYKGISGGLESGAGKAVGSITNTVGGAISQVNPLLGSIIQLGGGIIGGGINVLGGTSTDQRRKAANDAGTAQLNNFTSNASSFDEVHGPQAVANVQDAHKSGLLRKGWARKRNAADRADRANAALFAQNSLLNNVNNLQQDQLNDALANYSAFGGPIETGDMGAIDYGFMTDYLTQKKRENDMKSKMSGIVPIPAFMPNSFAIGGDLQTNGADWSDGLVTIGAGGSHETNPNEGIQMGVDNEGTPNLVEEGETIYNDYVFSNRILADEATKQMFRLPKKKDITFADISKKLEKGIAETPNDPISKSGFEKQMEMLEEQQERQKQEMEAERAKAAFEALSPEEQTALMRQRAEQEAMAQQQAIAEQQAAMQQPSQEEMLLAQQQQQMADGSGAALGQEPQMAANGGKLFAPGGYLWDKFWSPVNEYSKKKGNTKGKYQIDKEWKGNIKELENSEAYKAFTNYILNDATDEERMKYFQWIDANTGRDNKYITDGKLADNWKDMYQAARTDGLYGIQHYTPEWQAAEITTEPSVVTTSSSTSTPRVFHAMDGDDYDGYIEGELGPEVGAEVRRETLPNGDTVVYHTRSNAPAGNDSKGNGRRIVPDLRKETSFGLWGPAVGLGLMGLGVGKPDVASYDAAASGAGNYTTARWKPLGNYLTYRPLDIWYEQNVLNAQSRATDRALMNTSGGNRGTAMAGLLANGYNSQLASGNLFRQAQEYNDNLRKQVEDFNRGTNQFNSEQYGATSRFNADAYNNANRANAQMRLNAAQAKDDANRWWASNLYGNINSLFDNINQWEKWKRDHNSVAKMYANGLAGVVSEDTPVATGYVKAASEGGKFKRKKRGLTI